MTRLDLVNELTRAGGLSRTKSYDVVRLLLQTIRAAIKNGENVNLNAFGHWHWVTLLGRKIRNPLTGKVRRLPSRRVLRFKLAKDIRKKDEE